MFLAVHIGGSLLFVPRTVLAIAAGLLFGVGWGIVWAAIGSVAGAVAGFLVARYLNAGFVDLSRSDTIRPILERVERGGWRAVAGLRLIPVMPHSLANYGLGLTRLPLGGYAFGSLIGQLPMTIAYVDFGAAGERVMLGAAGWLMPTLIGAGRARLVAADPGRRPAAPALAAAGERPRHRAAGRPVEQFDRMHDRRGRARGELRDAADIAGGDEIGPGLGDIGELALAQLGRRFPAAADCRCRPSRSTDAPPAPRASRTRPRQQRLRPAMNALAVLHRAGGMIGDPPAAGRRFRATARASPSSRRFR